MRACAVRVGALAALLLVLLSGSGCIFLAARLMRHESVKARHRRDYADEQERFNELAAHEGWRAIVVGRGACSCTVSDVDFANRRIKHLFTTRQVIWRVKRLDDGRIMAYVAPRTDGEMRFVFIDPTGDRPTTTLRPRGLPESRAAPHAVLDMDERFVLYQVDYDVVRYDLEHDTYDRVTIGDPAKTGWPEGAFEANGFVFVWYGSRTHPYDDKGELVVVRASPPYEELARFPRAAAARVGSHILVLGRGSIREYDPASGTVRPLADGKFLCAAGETGFVYCGVGPQSIVKPVRLYDFASATSRDILVGLDCDFTWAWLAGLSPDLEYTFIHHSEYYGCEPFGAVHVYETDTGRQVGAYPEPYRGKLYISQTLEWLTERRAVE